MKSTARTVALAATALALGSLALQAGDLEPSAPPGATLKTLYASEPRQVIWGGDLSPGHPLVISQPGSYYLGEDIDATGKQGIEIQSSNVTIDLNGFTLKNGTGVGILSGWDVWNVAIRNGTVSGWTSHGIELYTGSVSDVTASDNLGMGITVTYLAQIRDCTAKNNGTYGIHAGFYSLVRGCIATGNEYGIDGVHASLVSGSTSNGNTVGIVANDATTVVDNVAVSNRDAGPRVIGWNTRIERNHVTGNDMGIEVYVGRDGNVIVRNSASTNTTEDYYIPSGNDLGPVGSAAGSTSPWANISN